MRIELTRLHKELGATTYVTHDQRSRPWLIKIVALRDGCLGSW